MSFALLQVLPSMSGRACAFEAVFSCDMSPVAECLLECSLLNPAASTCSVFRKPSGSRLRETAGAHGAAEEHVCPTRATVSGHGRFFVSPRSFATSSVPKFAEQTVAALHKWKRSYSAWSQILLFWMLPEMQGWPVQRLRHFRV